MHVASVHSDPRLQITYPPYEFEGPTEGGSQMPKTPSKLLI